MDGPLSRLADIGGDIRLAETLLATSNRYLAMIQHYMPTLTDREWGAIFDALRRTVDRRARTSLPRFPRRWPMPSIPTVLITSGAWTAGNCEPG